MRTPGLANQYVMSPSPLFDLDFETGLLSHLAERRLRDGLAGLRRALGQAPRAALVAAAEDDLGTVVADSVDDAPSGKMSFEVHDFVRAAYSPLAWREGLAPAD